MAAEREWSLDLRDVESGDARQSAMAKLGDRYILVAGMRIRGISAAGKQTWQRTFPRANDYDRLEVSVAGDVVIAAYPHPSIDRWPHPDVVVGIDPGNGATLWKTDASPYQSVIGNTVYTPVCRGKQTGASDDCQVSARDPGSGRVRWTVPAEHVATVIAVAGGVLAMTTRPMGFRGKHWLTTYDASTGRRLGLRAELERFGGGLYPKGQRRVSGPTFLAGGNVVLTSRSGERSPKKCELRMVALNARTGARRWTRDLPLGHPNPGEGCDALPNDQTTDHVYGKTGDGRPVVFDLAKGRTDWTGPPGSTVLASGRRVVLIQTGHGISLYDLTSGKLRWSDGAFPWSDPGTMIHGDRLVAYEKGYCEWRWQCYVRVYDLHRGLVNRAPQGGYAGSGQGWVGTKEENGSTWQYAVTSIG
jgi:hypothetical protein